jgi:predicted nucleic acid-binding protein
VWGNFKTVDTVYIETTIPSAYFERRPQPKIVARKEWTREWWDSHRHRYDLVTGFPVIEELSRGNHPDKNEKLDLIRELEILPDDKAIAEIVQVYLDRFVMPRDPVADALHLALASYHKADILLTWNCDHLANANKAGHIRRVNTILGLHVPMITTPLELLGKGPDE